jgi:hypothetical protein
MELLVDKLLPLSQLKNLDHKRLSIFIAATAYRTLAAYEIYASRLGPEAQPGRLREVMDLVIAHVRGEKEIPKPLLRTYAEEISDLEPDLSEDEEDSSEFEAEPLDYWPHLVDTSLMAISYCIYYLQDRDPLDAESVPCYAYDLSVQFASLQVDEAVSEEEFAQHPIVQREIGRQHEDVALLLEGRGDEVLSRAVVTSTLDDENVSVRSPALH